VTFDNEASVIHTHLLGLLAPSLFPFDVSSLLKFRRQKKRVSIQYLYDLFNRNEQTYRFHFYYVQNLQNMTKPGQQSQYTDYAIGWTIWGSNPAEARESSIFQNIQIGSGTNLTPIQGYWGLFPWSNVAGA
jgi:hypothetical protein